MPKNARKALGRGAQRTAAAGPLTRVISLNGAWQISTDAQNRGREEKWFAAGRKPPEAVPFKVPSVIQEAFPGYHGVAWYWRSFSAPRHPLKGGRFLLRFWAVDYLAEVWVNGRAAGGHEGGETPFVLDVTDVLKPGRNTVTVRVLNPTGTPIDGIVLKETPHRNKVDPPSPGSDLNHGGIFLPVEIVLAPPVRIFDVFAKPDWKTGIVKIQVAVRNELEAGCRGRLEAAIAPAAAGETLVRDSRSVTVPKGDTVLRLSLRVKDHRLWSLEDPFLYRLSVRLVATGTAGDDESSIRIGFRDFRVERGYFRLNGKRLILKSTHTGNCCPVGQVIPPEAMPDILRRDLLYAKSCGYNTVRFIAMLAHPWQLDLCDEIGLMVYEESYAAWLLADSPEMKRRFDLSVREMALRDRNHPSLTLYGMLNETHDGPVFRHAVDALSLLRRFDDTRLVMLSSGRWDGDWSIGSVSNPGSRQWDHVWGREAPGAGTVPATWDSATAAYLPGTGDAHIYPPVPHPPEAIRLIRTVGSDSRPVMLSEYGIGSMMDVVHETRSFEQHGCRDDLEDYRALREMATRLVEDMERWGMRDVYPFPQELLLDSQQRMARHRLFGFDLIRSNPRICGYNLTGMLDHALTGEGMWKYWRAFKPGSMDALQNGWWPLRWCVFVDPWHGYSGRPVRIEVVLANEDILAPGRYPVHLRVSGPRGIAWERRLEAVLPEPAPGDDPPLAVTVLDEQVTLNGPTGTYRLTADMERGAPLNRSVEFHLSDSAEFPRGPREVVAWGLDTQTRRWLDAHGVACRDFETAPEVSRNAILVGNLSKLSVRADSWIEMARRVARGSIAVFLSWEAFRRAPDPKPGDVDLGWLPLTRKGTCRVFGDGLYHKENVARPHPIFEGLQGRGILDWYYHGSLFPRYVFEGQDDPDEVIAAAFAAGYCGRGSRGYESGILMSSYRLGSGRFLINTFPVLDHLDANPVADRLMLNLVRHATRLCAGPPDQLPPDFPAMLRAAGYASREE